MIISQVNLFYAVTPLREMYPNSSILDSPLEQPCHWWNLVDNQQLPENQGSSSDFLITDTVIIDIFQEHPVRCINYPLIMMLSPMLSRFMFRSDNYSLSISEPDHYKYIKATLNSDVDDVDTYSSEEG